MVDKSITRDVEELFTDAGIMVIERVLSKDLRRAAEHTGARMIKRTGLKKDPVEIEKALSTVEKVYEDEKLDR